MAVGSRVKEVGSVRMTGPPAIERRPGLLRRIAAAVRDVDRTLLFVALARNVEALNRLQQGQSPIPPRRPV